MAQTKLTDGPAGTFLEGLLAATAMASLNGGEVGLTVAVLLACAVVLAWQTDLARRILGWLFGGLGLLPGSLAGWAYLIDGGCAEVLPFWGRAASLAGLAALFAWSFVHTLLVGRLFDEAGALGLSWFGMLELLTFVSMAAAVVVDGLGLAVVLGSVLILGYIVGFRPTLAVLVIGVGMVLVTLAGSAIVGTPAATGTECLQLTSATGAALMYLAGFVPAAFIWVIFVKPFHRRRS